MSESRAEDILQRALDIWDDKPGDRPRFPSGKFPAGKGPRTSTLPPAGPPPLPGSVAPPPLPGSVPPPPPRASRPSMVPPQSLAGVHKRIKDVENDIVFVIEATSKRLDLLEQRQRQFVSVIDTMSERLEALETWGGEMRESLESWGAELSRTTTDRADEVDAQLSSLTQRVTSLDTRTELQLEQLSEAVDAPKGLDELSGQLDRLLAQVSMWRAEYETLLDK